MKIRTVAIAAIALAAALVTSAFAYREFALIRPMKARLVEGFKDPDSAQFRNLRYYGDWTIQGGVLCGEVNAKNGMGGYVGYRHFEVFGTDIVDVYTDAQEQLLRDGIARWCNYEGIGEWWHLR